MSVKKVTVRTREITRNSFRPYWRKRNKGLRKMGLRITLSNFIRESVQNKIKKEKTGKKMKVRKKK